MENLASRRFFTKSAIFKYCEFYAFLSIYLFSNNSVSISTIEITKFKMFKTILILKIRSAEMIKNIQLF